MKRAFIVLFILIAFVSAIFIVVQIQFNRLKVPPFFYENPPQKFWAHRGYSINGADYSPNNFQLAKNAGFEGIELDLFYSIELKTFLVAHDMPLEDTLLIEDVLDETQNSFYYWFDLKNLNSQNVDEVITQLETLNESYQLQHHFMVESKEARSLYQLTKARIHTCLWLKTPRPQQLFQFYFWKTINMLTLMYYDFDAISIPYFIYRYQEYESFYKLNTCSWMGEEMVELHKNDAANNKQLKIVLVDRKY
ncbi:MAG: hypothetical protein KF732_06065 [Flavobacteriales bacterium]|nr:hypothetical protein [Flavobacteriales bacterium]